MKCNSTALLLTALLATLAGCGGSSSGAKTGAANASPSPEPSNRFTLANGCYALQLSSHGGYIDSDGGNHYTSGAATLSDAEAFYLKPARLGQYLLHDSRSRLMSATTSVSAEPEASDAAIWIVHMDSQSGLFTLESEQSGARLISDDSGALALGDANSPAQYFRFVPTTRGCSPYPEMPLNIQGPAYKGQGVDKPVIGFADVHSHFGMSHEMSTDDSVGPSAGGAFYGRPFHRLGVAHALGNCEEFHGPDGVRDGNNIIHMTPLATHVTSGWPSFIDWPAIEQRTHQSAYYRWVERAYRAGMRLTVSYGTNMNGLCLIGTANAGRPDADCNDHSTSTKQNNYVWALQDYIDAQSGGPGKGWFRIVTSPQQARQVINEGKLAVVLGLEASQLFDCGVTYLPGGIESAHCTLDSFNEKLSDAYARGVRHVIPIHNMSNAFGGSGILGKQGADSMNLLNFMDTKAFFDAYDCPGGGTEGFLITAGGTLTGIPATGDPLTTAVMALSPGTVPAYTPGVRQCNKRGLTELGEQAINRIMDLGIVLSLDHASLYSKQAMLDIAEQRFPPYPVISGHGAQGGISYETAKRLLRNGGYYYPYKSDGRDFVEFMAEVKALYDQAWAEDSRHMLPWSFGIGYDVNGFGGYNPPRPNPDQLVQYPFTLFQGEGWGPQFAAAGIAPVVVDQLSIPEGRSWHTDIDGTAHYGMLAGFVEEVRLEGGETAIDALYNSAEAYLQLWERIYQEDVR